MKGSLQAVSATFECKRCRRDMPPAEAAEENLEVDGETCCGGQILLLGDMLNVQGGADAAVTVRVRCAWQRFRELSPFLTP